MMRQSLVIVLTVYVSLVLCQSLDNRQQDLDEFITQLAQRNESRPIRPFQNPNPNQPTSSNQFWNGQNQGTQPQQQQQPWTGQNQVTPQQQPWNGQGQGQGQGQGFQPLPQQNTGQSSSFDPVSYPINNGQSPDRPTQNVNVSAFLQWHSFGK